MSSSERLERLLHELTHVQTHLQEFFEIPSDLFAVLKPNGIFRLVSPAWETVLGWSPPLLQTHCWTEFLHPLDVSSSHYHLQVLQNLASRRVEHSLKIKNRFRCRDSQYQWLSWSIRQHGEADEASVYAVVHPIEHPSPIADSHHQKMFEAAVIGCFQLGVNGHYTSVNLAMARMHGCRSCEEMLTWLADSQQPIWVDSERMTELMKLLQQHEIITDFELQAYSKRGEVVWVSLTAETVRDEEGNLLCYEGIAVDISRRKRAEAERMQLLASEQAARIRAEVMEQRFRELIDGLVDAIVWECDPETLQFTFVSRSAQRILGYPIDQWQSKSGFWENILHPDDRNWVVAFCHEETKQGRDHEFEYRCFTSDGRIVWLRDRVTLSHNCKGQTKCLRGLMVDITERKQAEIERYQLLERERANNRAKDEFLATVSHELRTPLTNMRLAIQMLQIATQPQSRERYLQILQTECTREIELINDLLDLQRLEAGVAQVEFGEVLLSEWLPLLVEPFIERFAERQQLFHLSIAPDVPTLISDPKYLGRIVSELLNNACKYTLPGCNITMTVHPIGLKAGVDEISGVELIVCNSGVEIPSLELNRIFSKFYRIASDDPWGQKGTGMGLALVAKLVELLGGTIQVESQTNKVSFIVTLTP
jgi:PAS domain S-box-containing protein